MAALREENRLLRKEREIIKKATEFLRGKSSEVFSYRPAPIFGPGFKALQDIRCYTKIQNGGWIQISSATPIDFAIASSGVK